MNVDEDILGRMAIRLGRAYSHGWAKDIPKAAPWSWSMMTLYIGQSLSTRLPKVDQERSTVSYDHSSSHWTFSPGKVEVTFDDRKSEGHIGVVRLGYDHLNEPYLHVRIEDASAMTDSRAWRMDRAITSLSCGPWRPLYTLPPLAVLCTALKRYLPKCPMNLYYRTGDVRIEAVGVPLGAEEAEACAAFERALRRYEAAGGFEKWDRLQAQQEEAGE